ncbi:MAG: phage tail tape measure protein, partial [Ardenticatenia bacterium]|nr:phage tail tape measure protein [Ardenticatenia bacterium]
TGGASTKGGQALTMGLTLPLVGVGLGAAKMAVDFDSAMMGVNSVLKLSEDKFRDLKGEILAFSTETSKSSADVAIALRGIVSTGFESADAMDILKVAVDSAGNMMVDTSTTTLALTSTLKAFGMEATEVTHVADVLQTAANNSAIQFDLLTTSIGTALGSAAAAGVSFEETAAALMTITDAGYSTQIATTNLNAVISALLKPGEDLTTMIAAWGYESGEAALKAIGLQGVMALLTEATGGSASELAVLLPNVRAFKGAVALAREDGAAFADSLDEIAAASVGAGEHAAMAAIRHESWAYQITKLKSEVEVFANRLAGVFMPAVIDIVNVLKDWATTLATLDPEMLKTIVTIAGIAAAVGPVLVVFAKLVAIGISVASGLSMLASGIETVIIGVSLLTGAGTMLGAALMTIAPIAVVAGLALLAKKVYDNIQAHKEFAAEAIHVSSTFTEYRQAVEDSDRWTTTLSEDVWELVQAQIELQGATGEAAAALAAHGIGQQKLLDAMQKASELQAGMSGHIAREVHERGEAAKAIILQDAALRAVALSMGLVTQAEFDLVEGVEASDRAMLEFAKNTQELREQTGFYAEAIKNVSAEQEQLNEQMARTSAQTERAAQITKTSLDEMAAAAKEARESLGETFENLGSTISSGYEQMQASADTYHAAMLSAQTDYDEQMAQIAEKGAQAQFLALEKYQLSQAQALGKYEAEAAALSAAGQTDRLADLTRSFDKSSTIAQYAFDMAEAQREQSEAIQTHVAQVAQAQREYDAALSHFNELSELQKFIGNKIMMWIALHKSEIDIAGGSADDMLRTVGEMFGSQLSLADQFNIGWKAFMKDWAEDSGKAIEGAATYWEGLHLTMKGELDKGAATMAAAQSRLDAIGAGWEPPALQAPAMPDFSQWTQEYSSGVSRGGSQIRESATKTLQQVTVDIAKAFETAMTVFEKVAGWKPLKGLAAGMKALREDIQLAVKEMYTAYQALGEEGVKGAGLMAEAATAVLATIG